MTTGPAADHPVQHPESASADRPLVILHTEPQPLGRIFTPAALAALNDEFRVVDLATADEPDRLLDDLLPEAFAIVGQPDLPEHRIARAAKLRALLNVEGNFYPNVDYAACFGRGVHVLGCGPAYAQAVAEYALGLALDLARGISREDRAFREGRERYLGAGNDDAVLLRNARIGFVGFGNLGRALGPLLAPFNPTIRVFDPWLPAAVLREADLTPATLEEVLSTSTFVFVLAAVTAESQHLIGPAQLDLLASGARLILVSRAAVVDYPAMFDRVAAGRFLAAVDVWPAEPVDSHDRSRGLEGLVLSAHRAGGIPAAFSQIGDMVVDDLTLIANGLPPVRMQAAARELVGRYRNRPAGTPGGAPGGTPEQDRSGTVEDIVVPADGVLFDSDGVLVDSDASVAQAWGRWARKYSLDPILVGEMVHGRRAADTVALLIAPDARAAALTDIDAFEVTDAAAVTPIPGALELTGAIDDGRWAVVTSANRTLARARLSAAGITAPDVLITADDVSSGKPDPEGYLAAARRIRAAPERVIVLEDAASGVEAARAAGVGVVIGVGERALDTDADIVVADLSGITWTGSGLRIAGAGILRTTAK